MSYLYTLRGAASRLIRPAPAAAARTAPGTCARVRARHPDARGIERSLRNLDGLADTQTHDRRLHTSMKQHEGTTNTQSEQRMRPQPVSMLVRRP